MGKKQKLKKKMYKLLNNLIELDLLEGVGEYSSTLLLFYIVL